MSAQIENVAATEQSAGPAKERSAVYKMDTSEVYRAVATGNLEFLRANKSEIGSFVSTGAKNTILHIYIITQSKREAERTMLQKLLRALKSLPRRFKEAAAVPSSPAEIVQAMLKEWPSLLWKANGKGDTPLHMAARHGHEDIVEVLIDHSKMNIDVAADQEEDMEGGQVDYQQPQRAVWKMLHKTNADKETPLHQAVRYGHYYVAQVLIDEDDPSFLYSANEDGETPLYLAAERCASNLIKMILDKYTSPAYEGPDGRTALHAAALLSTGYDVEAIVKKKGLEFLTTKVDDQGRTPLHYNVSWMLKHDKSAAFVIDNDGNTALHIVASQGYSWSVKRFIEECPECFELVDGEGRNALHLAIQSCDEDTVNLILENEFLCDLLKQKDDNGNTPLHLVAQSPYYHWPKVIADPRVDKMAINKDKLNPCDVLYRNKFTLSKVERRMANCMYEALIRMGPRTSTDLDTKNIRENCNDKIDTGNNGREDGNLKEERQSHLVVAALVATVTFAAGFTLPGGYIQEKGPDLGYAVLTKNSAFVAFIISDSFGLVLSCAAVFIHLLMAMDDYKENRTVERLFSKALPLTLLAIVAMVIAFITGTYAVLSHSKSLALSASIIGGVFFYLLGYLVEEARNSDSFPIFGGVLHGMLYAVEWLLYTVQWLLETVQGWFMGLMHLLYHPVLVVLQRARRSRSRKDQTHRAAEGHGMTRKD